MSGKPYSGNDPEELKRCILNSIGTENATGTILWELDQIRKGLGVPTVTAKAIEDRTEREEVKHLVRLLSQADEQIDDLKDELRDALVEVEFHRIRSDEWERRYNFLMESCHCDS